MRKSCFWYVDLESDICFGVVGGDGCDSAQSQLPICLFSRAADGFTSFMAGAPSTLQVSKFKMEES